MDRKYMTEGEKEDASPARDLQIGLLFDLYVFKDSISFESLDFGIFTVQKTNFIKPRRPLLLTYLARD